MTPPRATVGDRELELLRWIEARRETTVGEASEGYGADQGLARSTVMTMMERLRRKGLLRRRATGGLFRYRLARSAGKLAHEAVAGFVEKTLGGSLTPFVAYLAERESIDDAEMAELEALLEQLRERQGRDEP